MYRLKFLKTLVNKCFSTKPSSNVLEHLKERALLRVSGDEVLDFLQGLITNDIKHVKSGQGSLYTMFLNTKGRVLYDSIIYNTVLESNTFFIECDVQAVDALIKHLKLYRVRRKVDITNVKNEYKIYALYNPDNAIHVELGDLISCKMAGAIVPCNKLNESRNTNNVEFYGNVRVYDDPRSLYLGLRIIAPENVDVKQDISNVFNINSSITLEKVNYRCFRYHLGVGEGVSDLPPGNCFPLEANCDYLHGVSFHKGCYIGQELTARTHHTGVVRKRLMPLLFSTVASKLPAENTILHENNNLGKLRGVEGKAGLGLLRISKALEVKEIKIGNGVAKTMKPKWWPVEMTKEKFHERSEPSIY